MGYTKVKGIVVKSFDKKEKDKLIKIFTLENGFILATLKGVKSAKAKLKATKEPFCFAEFLLEGENNVVTSAEIIDSFYDLSKDVKKLYCASLLLDIVQGVLKENQKNPQLFINLIKALKIITYEQTNLYYVLDKFLIDVFSLYGLKFSFDKCSNCGVHFGEKRFLNLDYSEIVCPACRAGRVVEIPLIVHKTMVVLSQTNYDNLKNLKLAENSETETYKILALKFENQFSLKLSI